ncbi:hypothetical protein HW561_22820 [Rhodobacteraceae bacterium B1Z28]|uniref:ATPase BadF/BadG/BcrA/BcrD type domain-containing protein n=1 Tax=Ruegeria haliotis TaxID=2747601 RepID=A0ABX2PWM4_9RHOB|nr:BadF/BadG/BcrA/BcrD ATPase family protein [Ruegeria haliotis]NVO58614.1 hypothetical protein [Ruegeria haliotis]
MSDSAYTLIIGVDGGGTGCRAAIGTTRDGVLATAQGGRANASSDFELAIRNINATVSEAAAIAGLSEDRLSDASAHLGLAGVMTRRDGLRVSDALHFNKSIVTDDRTTALYGALGGKDGFLLSVGTGTIAAAKKGGVDKAVGGWGFQVSDQASGAWLGRKALEQVLLCHDGLAEHTNLTRALLSKFDSNPCKISSFSTNAKPGDFGALAPEIVAAARGGDQWARSIMQSGADHLLRCLEALEFQSGQPICMTGGVGPHYADYLPPMTLIGRQGCLGSALDGAFQLAKRAVVNTEEAAS